MSGSAVGTGIVFVLSGPSGVGKSSILRAALAADDRLRFSVSHTTRKPRDGERDGVDYSFVDEAGFRALVEADAFLEHAEYQGNLYGTSRLAVSEPIALGSDLILEVEVQGAGQLREQLPDAVSVFVLPPSSMSDLESRLRGRRSDDDQTIAKRLEIARQELTEAEHYEYAVVNDELDRAVARLLSIVGAERLRRSRVLPRWQASFDSE